MKLSSKPLKFIILATLILMISCGKKDKGRFVPGNYYNNLPQNIQANIAGFLEKYPCSRGRLPEIVFSVRQFMYSGNQTKIQGQPQPGTTGGIPSNSYIGVNCGTNDVVVVTKMTSGRDVLGFDIALSFCRTINTDGNPLIDYPARIPVVVGLDAMIVVDSTYSTMGEVSKAKIYYNIPAYTIPGTNAILDPIPNRYYPYIPYSEFAPKCYSGY